MGSLLFTLKVTLFFGWQKKQQVNVVGTTLRRPTCETNANG